jgi:hypothetical protein
MSLRLSYRQEPKYLVVEMSGEFTAHNFEEATAAVHDEAQKRGLTQLLVDSRAISLPDSQLTRVSAGVCWARTFPRPFKASFIVRPELYNGFAETVALDRGADVASFFEEEKAVKWLVQQ